MDALRHKLHDAYKTAAEAVLPVRTESAFAERGVRESVKKPGGNAWWLVGFGCSLLPSTLRGVGGEGDAGVRNKSGRALTRPPSPPPPFRSSRPRSLFPRVTSWCGRARRGRGERRRASEGGQTTRAGVRWPKNPDPPLLLFLPREGGDPAKARPYLPPDKQYLVTRNGEEGERERDRKK